MSGAQNTSTTGRGVLFALAAVLIWTGFILVSRAGALTSLGMTDMLAVRFGTAFVVLAPLAWKLRQRLLTVRTFWLGMIGGLGYGLFVYAGFGRAPATHAALLLPGLMPVMIAVLAWLFAGESKSLKVWLGIAVSSLGILVLLMETLLQGNRFWLGDLSFVMACVCWAIYTVLLRAWRIEPWTATVGVVMVTALLYLPVYLTVLPTGIEHISWQMLLVQSVYQGVLATIIQMICYVRAVQILGATRMGALMALVPVLAGALAVPLFGETATPGLIASILLVILGSIIGNLPISAARQIFIRRPNPTELQCG